MLDKQPKNLYHIEEEMQRAMRQVGKSARTSVSRALNVSVMQLTKKINSSAIPTKTQ